MRTDILDLHRFYQSPLGAKASAFIASRLNEVWGEAKQMRIGGFGFTGPYLDAFPNAERRLNFAPAGQGVIRWPPSAPGDGARPNCASLVQEGYWPLPDASLDRVLIVHGLEETSNPRRLMREVWRVLSPEGKVVIVAAHRRGLWSSFDMSPFAAGRPYSNRQLRELLQEATFNVVQHTGALFFPPVNSPFLLRAARYWERAGGRVWSGLSGVLMVEASKNLEAPVGKVIAQPVRIQRRAGVRPVSAPGGSAPRKIQ